MQLNRVATLFIVACSTTVLPAPALLSQVVINEIMQNPEFASDTDGEWFELHNIGESPIDLNGWTIKDDGSNNHVIDAASPVTLVPHGYLVFGRNADTTLNGNVIVDYSYGSAITFGNGIDQLVLVDPDGIERDRVGYDDGVQFPDPTGASMELIHPGVDNSLGSNWREAVTPWSGNDRGTPGFVNSVFDSVPPTVISVSATLPTIVEVLFSEAVDSSTAGTPTNYAITPGIGKPEIARRDSNNAALVQLTIPPLSKGVTYALSIEGVTDIVGNMIAPGSYPFVLAEPLAENDVIITEIMKDPLAAGDTDGEWFEVYNTTRQSIDMGGWRIYDGGSNSFTIQGSFVVSPASFAVFCINTDSAINGGLHAATMYDWGSSGAFTLGNADDKIIMSADGVLIDSISYDSGTLWPDLTGASMGLADFSVDNNAGENWTAAPVRQPAYVGNDGDLGSPGTMGDNQSPGSGPFISVEPDTIQFVIPADEVVNLPLILENRGTEALTWSISSLESACAWLVVVPEMGEVPPGSAESTRVRLSSEGLVPGVHSCTLVLESNDPNSPQILVPVHLGVIDTPVTGTISIPAKFLPIPEEGDTVSMDMRIFNRTEMKESFDIWATLLRPGEPEPRELLDLKPIKLSPFQEFVRTRSLRIQQDSPAGVYTLTLHMGLYPDSVFASSTFLFEKIDKGTPVSAVQANSGIPERTFLDQAYPSPFNAATTILYGIAEDTWVTLTIYDLLGREIVKLVNEFQFAGYKTVAWNGRNGSGLVVASGPYLYRLDAGSFTENRSIVFLK